MFTGIIEEIGIIKSIESIGSGKSLTIKCNKVLPDIKHGDSIAINGVCQTVETFSKDEFSVFVSDVTLKVTTLNGLLRGVKVNLERAMSFEGRFGGHIVQGHIDGKGIVANLRKDNQGKEVQIKVNKELTRYIVNKGSIAINGVSLTVVDIKDNIFTIYLIPESLRSTTFNTLKTNENVNIEVDIFAKYIEKMVPKNSSNDENNLKRKIIEGGF